MKKLYTFLAMAMLTMMTFTSCDVDYEDRMEARTLEGTWTGYIDNYYYDRWGLSGSSYRTAFYFERENAYGGWGYWTRGATTRGASDEYHATSTGCFAKE